METPSFSLETPKNPNFNWGLQTFLRDSTFFCRRLIICFIETLHAIIIKKSPIKIKIIKERWVDKFAPNWIELILWSMIIDINIGTEAEPIYGGPG